MCQFQQFTENMQCCRVKL